MRGTLRRDTWRPTQGVMTFGDKLRAGDVIALDVAGMRHQPWVLHDVRDRGEGNRRILVRPVGAQFDFAQYNTGLTMSARAFVYVLPEHYALCAKCGELPPCADVWTGTLSDAAAARSARYEVEGVCPSCQEPITARQKSHRFEENLFVPLGPPVTFHARRSCGFAAVEYDVLVAKATDRDPLMSCDGLHVQHLDNFHECTNITCPGMMWRHRSFARCYVLDARCNRPQCWAIEATKQENGSK